MTDKASMQGKLFLIVGPSGSGKGTVIKKMKAKYIGFIYPISYTTRDPREGEVDGDVYHFISRDKFQEMIDAGEFLEYATVHETDFYGTSKKDIMDGLSQGNVVMREVDIQGFNSIKEIIPEENLVSIFMKVVGEEDLKKRILMRGEMSDAELARRMESTLKEIAQADKCKYQVENKWGEITACVANVEKIILDEIKDIY
ncbi:guanylate kinase [Candidatus Gracilibacteria bacterium]|nr:guanylate kinase [Candidatus Gracilibacteria bacterium]